MTPETDLIIRGNRLVIPTKLRQQVISLAHEGHQGLIKTKKLLREKVWFPKINTLTEKAVKECLACQSVGQPSKPAPIQPMPFPQQAWDVIYVDFLGPLPTKDWLSRGRNSSQYERQSTIQCFESIFSRHGIPRTIVSDNGPPFQGDEIRQYMSTNGIKHRKITPHMATSKRRRRDVHETANELSTDGSRRTQRLETRATAIPAELPRHAPLYDKSTARHSTVRTKHPHQVTREIFERKHGIDRQEYQRS